MHKASGVTGFQLLLLQACPTARPHEQQPTRLPRPWGTPVELFQILEDDAVKVLHSICQQINLENSAVATGLEKVGFHSNPKERQCQRMLTLLHSCTHLTR